MFSVVSASWKAVIVTLASLLRAWLRTAAFSLSISPNIPSCIKRRGKDTDTHTL